MHLSTCIFCVHLFTFILLRASLYLYLFTCICLCISIYVCLFTSIFCVYILGVSFACICLSLSFRVCPLVYFFNCDLCICICGSSARIFQVHLFVCTFACLFFCVLSSTAHVMIFLTTKHQKVSAVCTLSDHG